MKFFITYLMAFILFGTIGTIRSCSGPINANSPIILKNLDFDINSLFFACENTNFQYNVDTNQLTRQVRLGILTRDYFWARSEFDEIVLSFIGGLSGGYSLKDLRTIFRSKVTWSKKAQRYLAIILGGASGYTAGLWAGNYLFKSCNSSNVFEYIKMSENWRDIEVEVGLHKLTRLASLCRPYIDDLDGFLETYAKNQEEKARDMRIKSNRNTTTNKEEILALESDFLDDILVKKYVSDAAQARKGIEHTIKRIIENPNHDYAADEFRKIEFVAVVCLQERTGHPIY